VTRHLGVVRELRPVKHGEIAEDANGFGLSFRDPDNTALEFWAPRS
jgi:hypothetical protein